MDAPPNAVRRTRRAAGLTQASLAGKVGVSRQTLIAIEQGGGCSLATAMGLSRELGASVDDLFPHHAAAADAWLAERHGTQGGR